MSVQSVLEELTGDELPRAHVQRRVDDWAQRIEHLYSAIEGWLPEGWTARRGPAIMMHEEVMETRGVPPRELPTLLLLRDGEVKVRLRPYGLWIIGANGWIDLTKDSGSYRISDRARIFQPADWCVAPMNARRESKPLDRGWLEALLAE